MEGKFYFTNDNAAETPGSQVSPVYVAATTTAESMYIITVRYHPNGTIHGNSATPLADALIFRFDPI